MPTFLDLPNELLLGVVSLLGIGDATRLKNANRDLQLRLEPQVYAKEKTNLGTWAVEHDHASVLQKAILYGFDPNDSSNSSSRLWAPGDFTLVEMAVVSESPACLKVLLDHGGSVPAVPLMLSKYMCGLYKYHYNFLDLTASTHAVAPHFDKLTECFDLLIEQGGSLNTGRSNAWKHNTENLTTCIVDLVMFAVPGGLDFIRFLLDAGVKFKSFKKGKDTPFYYAVTRYERTFREENPLAVNRADLRRLMQLMLEQKQGADMDAKKSEESWGTPWQIAKRLKFRKRDSKLFKLLNKFRRDDPDGLEKPDAEWLDEDLGAKDDQNDEYDEYWGELWEDDPDFMDDDLMWDDSDFMYEDLMWDEFDELFDLDFPNVLDMLYFGL